jgi:hypothetical protein
MLCTGVMPAGNPRWLVQHIHQHQQHAVVRNYNTNSIRAYMKQNYTQSDCIRVPPAEAGLWPGRVPAPGALPRCAGQGRVHGPAWGSAPAKHSSSNSRNKRLPSSKRLTSQCACMWQTKCMFKYVQSARHSLGFSSWANTAAAATAAAAAGSNTCHLARG